MHNVKSTSIQLSDEMVEQMKTRKNERECSKINYILGIEGSANKLGISIINGEKKILINSRRTFISEIGCGFIPREVSTHHKHFIIEMVKECLNKLKIKITDINLICYTKGPGIGSALYIGYNICKILSSLFHIPVVGVNHCIAHIEMGIHITKLLHPIILYVSGSNTQIIYFNDHKKKYEIVGETLDIAIGNVIDRSARILKISNSPSPGYNVEQLAKKKRLLNILKKREMNPNIKENSHNGNDTNTKRGNIPSGKRKIREENTRFYNTDYTDYTELLFFPYTIKGMDISFSGYDFYINKYFAKYIQKNKQVEKLNWKMKNKKHIGNELNRANKTEEEKQAADEKELINKDLKENESVSTTGITICEGQHYRPHEQNEIMEKNEKIEPDKRASQIINDVKKETINTEWNNLTDVPGIHGKSYYEDNVIYENEHKKNFGDNDIYIEENCSIETESDFYEKESVDFEVIKQEDEEELKNLSEEEKRKIQICYSLQHHIFSMLIEITERAISFTNSKEVIIVGGVGCNVFLQNMMKKMAMQKNIKIGFMDHSYCVDNGAMIAYTGYLEYIHAKDKTKYNFENISIHQRFRTDDVLVTWR